MKLVYVEATSEEAGWLKNEMSSITTVVTNEPLRDGGITAEMTDAEILSVFVDSMITKAVLDEMPRLKLIATRSTGFDHIDAEECHRRGIVISYVPSYGENTVAEHAFALILSLSRKIFQSYERTERMNFNREGLRGFDLYGKTLGVVGTGRIGRHSIRIGRAFGMKIVAYDSYPNSELASKEDFEYVKTLDDLLAQSDVITLHVPYIPETHHIINKENIKKIKRGAILVNTARGGLVDTEALLWALEEGVLSGAGLDVIEGEKDTFEEITLLSRGFSKEKDIATLLRNHILVARDDVIITPHNAFNSVEAVRRIFDTTVENINGFIDGTPVNTVQVKS